jgi:hypothetical protein
MGTMLKTCIRYIPTSFPSVNSKEESMTKQYDDLEDEEEIIPKKKKPPVDDDDEDEAPKKKSSKLADDDEDEAPRSKKSKAPVSHDDDEDVDFGDEDLMKNNGFLERIEVKEKGQFARFTILSEVKPKRAFSHYVEGKGSFRCFTDQSDKKAPKAACCKHLGEPGLDIVALVLQYTNASPKDGKLKKDAAVEFKIKFIKLSRAQYAKVSRLAEEDGTVYGIDILMFQPSSGIGYDYTRISSKAKYLSNPELVAAVKEELAPYLDGSKLSSRLPKKIAKGELNGYLTAANKGDDDESDLDEIEDI